MSESEEVLKKLGLQSILCPSCLYCRSIDYDGVVTCMLNGKQKLKVYCADYEANSEVEEKK
jgi:hypothetical protein